MGRKRRFATPAALEAAWEEFKYYCDHQEVLCHDFSNKNSEFVSAVLIKKITYTIEGFCVYAGIARSKFYEIYARDEKYRNIVTRMKEECEVDVRAKFETGQIPSQLSGLWMSKFGYSTSAKVEAEVKPVVISGDDALV